MRPVLFSALLFVFAAACSSGGQSQDPSGLSGSGLYIALGDSLSEGVGASTPDATSFVALVDQGLGETFGLMNLGHSGDTSGDLLDHGHLGEALDEIDRRGADGDPDNDVKLVTLEIGGNDLLGLYFSRVVTGVCPTVRESLGKPRCVDALQWTLDRFRSNLALALDGLIGADEGVTIVVMTLYNPFSGGIGALDDLVELALEGAPNSPIPEGLNDIIRSEAGERPVTLVDWYALFVDKAGEYIAGDLIHPNDGGHEVMAGAVLEAVR